jgi:hypothetical protein
MTKQKFKALKKKILLPDNYHFFDLGEYWDFNEANMHFLTRKLPSDVVALKERLSPKNVYAKGYCKVLTGFRKGREEIYGFIAYRPKKAFKLEPHRIEGVGFEAAYWITRGHEEGHIWIHSGLDDEIDNITGGNIDHSDIEAVCDLLGLHAADIRRKGHLISPEKRHYFERARRWVHYREEAEETHRQALAKEGETAVMSVDDIMEMRKILEGEVR